MNRTRELQTGSLFILQLYILLMAVCLACSIGLDIVLSIYWFISIYQYSVGKATLKTSLITDE